MGKNFPEIKTLSEKPHLLDQTLHLIENSFGYEDRFAFKSDFAPLMSIRNHSNNFILIDENENVLAHLGARTTNLQLNYKNLPLCMLGGIAVAEDHRGKGYLSILMNHVISELRDEVCAFILWSNQELYKKYGFNLSGEQYESSCTPSAQSLFKKTKYASLNIEEKRQIQKLYQLSLYTEPGLERKEEDWREIEEIKDTDLYVEKKGDLIENYFFVGKGQDLQGIAHEFGSMQNIIELRKRARKVAKVWGPSRLTSEDTLQYQFMLCPGDRHHFVEFVRASSNQKIEVQKINLVHQKVEFLFEGAQHESNLEDFLKGLLGPGKFDELSDLKALYIRGLDSI